MSDSAQDITQSVADWVRLALDGAEISIRGSGDPAATDAVEIRLLGIAPHAPHRVANAPAELALDYLISVRNSDPLKEHHAAAELMFAALDRHDLEIVSDRSAAEGAASLGLPPAAGLVVRAVLSRSRARSRAPLVRFPLQARLTGVGEVEGLVLGPEDTPVAGARISLPGLNRSARTDIHGRFRVPGPLPDTVPVRVVARARGVEIEALASPGEPAVLHLPLEI